jgi:hypothetical protein
MGTPRREYVDASVGLRMAGSASPPIVRGMDDLDHSRKRPSNRPPLVRSFVQRIEGAPDAVFPLLCPVREGEWLEGWAERCELIWSASGVAEPGCVFRTTEDDRPETIWIVTDHDPDGGLVVFARVTPGLAASTLHIEVSASGDGTSAVAIRYTVVPTSPEGEAYAAERYDRAELLGSVVWWERSMNHYLRTGRLLRREGRGITSKARAAGPDRTDKE